MRKYYEYQEQARQLTTGLCALLALAVFGTVLISALALAGVTVGGAYAYLSGTTTIKMPPHYWHDVFVARFRDAGVLMALLVVGTAVVKSFQLADGGGHWVARWTGGTRISESEPDPSLRRLRNIVEELAIATSLRTPPVYVLKDEPAINAFAAGYGEKDAVVAVTRGAVDRLQRSQLQGVLAHEFSHIANGDIRLNIRLLGVLTGIQAIAFVARYLLRLGTAASSGSGRGSGSGRFALGMVLALAFGAALWPIGQIGSFFALLITSAVNRQREFLADASAVQFTRDPDGLREALTILADEGPGNHLRGAAARAASHMFFAAAGAWQRLLETHPPLQERIRRLETAAIAAPTPLAEALLPNSVTQD